MVTASGLRLMHRALVLTTSGLGLATGAHAQSAPPQGGAATAQTAAVNGDLEIQDIVITAQKRSTSLQRTPLAVTALSGQALQDAQIRGLEDINGYVPAVKIGERSGTAQITIRGIGINNFVPLAESAVALNLNEVYVSRPVAFLAGLYDISDLEVLRGPQGTLYGRNATAGAVNFTTTRPTDDLSGYATATIGNYGLFRVEGAIGGALVDDKVLVRVAAVRERRGGYGKNITTDKDVDDKDADGIRGTLVLKPTPTLKATIIGEYFKENDNSGGYHYAGEVPGETSPPFFLLFGGTVPSHRRDMATQLDPIFKLRTTAVTGLVDWGDGPFSVKSITGYRDQNSLLRINLSGGDPGTYFLFGEPAHQFSQELQLHYDRKGISLTGGAYYFTEHDDYAPGVIFINNAVFRAPPGYTRGIEVGGLQKTTAKAVFGEATVNITDALSVTAGLRYSSERKRLFNRFLADFRTPFTGDLLSAPRIPASKLPSRTFNSTTPKFGIQYQVNPRTLLYATYAKGFKSGGFAASTPDPIAAAGFSPEKLTDIEGGIKTTLLDNRLRVNIAGFHYSYSDLQVQQINGPVLVTANAASARIYGGEAEVAAVITPTFTIDGNASWTHARYRRYFGPSDLPPYADGTDFAGKRLANAPDFQGQAAAIYARDLGGGKLSLRGELEYSAKFYFSPTNNLSAGQKAFTKLNASVAYRANAGWHAKAFIRNITDRDTRSSAGISHSSFFGALVNEQLDPPRTFGVEVGYSF